MSFILDSRKPKKVYHWNKKTKEYTGEGFSEPDPNDVNNWQISSNATTQEPPAERKGYVRKWNGEKWGNVKK
jgi:hypothetical protein